MRQRGVPLDELPELLVRDPAVLVLVQVEDGAVHDLLQLVVGQVLAGHHLQDLENNVNISISLSWASYN